MRRPSAATPRCSRRVGGPAIDAPAQRVAGPARSRRAPAARARARRPARTAGRRRSPRRRPRAGPAAAAGHASRARPAVPSRRQRAARRRRGRRGSCRAPGRRAGSRRRRRACAPRTAAMAWFTGDRQVGQAAPAVARGVVEVDARARGAVAPEAADDGDAAAHGRRDDLAARLGRRLRRPATRSRWRRRATARRRARGDGEEREHAGKVPAAGASVSCGGMDDVADAASTATQDASERRASYLELFFDLVFVYAVTQIATLIIGDTSPGGFARAALMLGMIWWAWSAFALDDERHRPQHRHRPRRAPVGVGELLLRGARRCPRRSARRASGSRSPTSPSASCTWWSTCTASATTRSTSGPSCARRRSGWCRRCSS